MQRESAAGHLAALFTILIWGTTFISTKVLLVHFAPIEILFYRFLLGLVALLVFYPHRLRITHRRQELLFAAAGLCGVTLYYLLENIALTYTQASNVGVIISVSPFFTALLAHFFLDGETLRPTFFAGFAAALGGICLITFSGSTALHLNPLGDLLALLAAMVWAAYSVLTRKLSALGYPTVAVTRRVFCYGLLFMLPVVLCSGAAWDLSRLAQPVNLANLVFLGLGASAVCFVTWGFSVKVLGAVKTSVYIYMVPVVTILTSVLVLREEITPLAAAGTLLTLAGLFLSERRAPRTAN